mmetsp:Transcript_121772/g.355829  ORF Transcript_121772/g.355829 Transcript_121772/m.355829 type:complete len:118 (+) Transcript_121772:554-907(+)
MSKAPQKMEPTAMATPKKKVGLEDPVGPPLCATTTMQAQTTPAIMQPHSPGAMSCDFLWISVCEIAVDSGRQERMMKVRERGIKTSERRLRPIFKEKLTLRSKTSITSLREASGLGE